MATTGGCLCGAVRYSSEAAPAPARACWCRLCQYLGAGGGTVNFVLPLEGLTLTGTLTEHIAIADSGTRMRRQFCPVCGTPVTSAAESRPDIVVFRSGTLDDPNLGAPNATIWTSMAPAWACFDEKLPQFPEQAPPLKWTP
jgi:hypothetical protein